MHFPRPRSARQVVRRPAFIAGAALLLLVALAPFLPDRTSPDDAIVPVDSTPQGAVSTEVTPQMKAEIDRVVEAGSTISPARARTLEAPAARTRLAQTLTRCAELGGQRYCLGVGFTHRSADEVARSLARPMTTGRETTGDLDPLAALARTAQLRPAARARADRAELTEAALSVGKVWKLRHAIEGVEVPAQFRTSDTTTGVRSSDYPRKSRVLRNKWTRSQATTYYCGPATMQMIGWGAHKKPRPQNLWARRLGTTTAGTAITEMVRVINRFTHYDDEEYAGRYITLDISDYTFKKWYLLMMRHIHDYRAPVVLHPVLEKRYYPYLDDDASGHFQVGRGFRQNPNGRPKLGYFEPWDQSRFDPSEPFIRRVQWRNAYRSYRANKAHFQHNVGV